MVDTKALRSRILDMAIRGKLTEQLESDGTAEELYQQIQAEKLALIKEGKIKKEKPLPEISADEIPFEIPSNWKYVTLSSITTDKTLNDGDWVLSTDMVSNGDVKLIQLGSIGECNYVEKGFKYLTYKHFQELKGKQIYPGYLLINRMVGEKLLDCIIPPIEGVLMTAVDVCWIAPKEEWYNIEYLMYMLASASIQKRVKELGYGTTRFRISKLNLINIYFPLPPLAEQKRIVERVEEIFRLLDTIDQAQEKYYADSQILKAKLITAGIQGKLTKQLESDGTAHELYQRIQEEKQKLIKEGKIKKEKPLPPISPDEIPFEIPQNWMWVRLGEISKSIWAGRDKPDDFVTIKDDIHSIPVVANGVTNEGILGYTEKATVPKGTITVAGRGTIGFSVHRTYDYCPIVRLIVIEQSAYIEPIFLQFVMQLFPESSVGSSIPQLTVPMIKPKLIPLPPLAEQKRIAAVLEKLLGVVE